MPVGPAPIRHPMLNERGLITQEWSDYLRSLDPGIGVDGGGGDGTPPSPPQTITIGGGGGTVDVDDNDLLASIPLLANAVLTTDGAQLISWSQQILFENLPTGIGHWPATVFLDGLVVGSLTITDALSVTRLTTPGPPPTDMTIAPSGDLVLDPASGRVTTDADVVISTMTAGSVIFAGAGGLLSQDNANLFWNDTTNRLGIGTSVPSSPLHITSTAAASARVTSTDPSNPAFVLFENTGGSAVLLGIDTNLGTGFATGALPFAAMLMQTGAYPLQFATSAVVRVTIDATGKVGVGTATPTYEIDVLATASGPHGLRIKNTSTAAGNTHASIFMENSSSYGQLFKAGTGYAGYKNIQAGDLGFFNITAGNISVLNDAGTISFAAQGAGSPHVTIRGFGAGFGVTAPTAWVHLGAGLGSASTAPLKFTSGTLLTSAEAGAVEFLTDTYYATITTGTARKGLMLDDGARLTPTLLAVATTNGRLIDGPANAVGVLTNDGAGVLTWGAGGGGGGGTAGGSLVFLRERVASSSATLDFTTDITSAYDEYVVELLDIVPATNGSGLLLRFSTNGGSSYDATNYASAYNRWSKTGASVAGQAAGTSIDLGGELGISNDATEQGMSGHVRLFNPLGATGWKKVTASVSWWYQASPELLGADTAGAFKTTSAVNAIRFLTTSGNIASGRVRLYGVAKIGAGAVPWSIITGTPTTLAGYGITDAQPLDAELTALAALANTAGVLTNNGAGVLSWAAAGGGGISGTGTTGKLSKWASSSSLADSIMSEASAVITVAGEVSINTSGQGLLLSSRFPAGSTDGRNVWIGGGGASVTGGATDYGSWNVAVGYNAMRDATTAHWNVAIGTEALRAITTATEDVAVGWQAGLLITSGVGNVAVGFAALTANVTSSGNVAVGWRSLGACTTSANTAVGYHSAPALTTGTRNVAVGAEVMAANQTGNYNVAVGYESLSTLTDGVANVAVGYGALTAATITTANTGLGYQALLNVTTGVQNVGVGWKAGWGITTGSYNTILGANVTGLPAGLANTVIIADGQGNQRLTINSSGLATFAGDVTITRAAITTLSIIGTGSPPAHAIFALDTVATSSAYIRFARSGVAKWAVGMGVTGSTDTLEWYDNVGGGQRMALSTAGALLVASTVTERGRAVAMGDYVSVSYAAGNFTADTGTWTVDAGDQIAYQYRLVGASMRLVWNIQFSTVGTTGALLRIALPGGFTIGGVGTVTSLIRTSDAGGAVAIGYARATAGNAYIEVRANLAGAGWTASSNNTLCIGDIEFAL